MLLKEKGYDAFLEQQIKIGQQAIKEGKVVSQEEAKRRTQAMIDRLALELVDVNNPNIAYG